MITIPRSSADFPAFVDNCLDIMMTPENEEGIEIIRSIIAKHPDTLKQFSLYGLTFFLTVLDNLNYASSQHVKLTMLMLETLFVDLDDISKLSKVAAFKSLIEREGCIRAHNNGLFEVLRCMERNHD